MYIGRPVRRDEDWRYLTGRATFTDDIHSPDALHISFVRSPFAHARINSIDITPTTTDPAVCAVLTAADWAQAGLGVLPCVSDIASSDGTPMRSKLRLVFAEDVVRHVGDTVAAVVARTREAALEAAEQVAVDYEELDAQVNVAAAGEADSPLVHDDVARNRVHWLELGEDQRTKDAFARAHHVTRIRFRHQRVTGNPIEPRACLAEYDPVRERFTLWCTGQNPHFLRRLFATYALGIPLSRLRVVCPDVGGGFGTKFYAYPEQAISLFACRLLGQPVRWTATRSESLLSDTHARDHEIDAAMAFDEHCNITAVRSDVVGTYGAYQSTYSPIIVMQTVPGTLPGMYRVPTGVSRTTGVYTHTTPVDAYRGTKQLPAMIHEFLIDRAARELGIDALSLRAQNYLHRDDYPHTQVFGTTYDSGDPIQHHQTLELLVDYQRLREEQLQAREDGQLLGIGIAAVVESTGLGPSQQLSGPGLGIGGWEAARVTLEPDGTAEVYVGTHSHGQSHEITFRQIAADSLGLPLEGVVFSQGDTDLGPGNMGTAAARALLTAGVGVELGCSRVIAKCTRLAAHMLECAERDVKYRQGRFSISGTDRFVELEEVSAVAYSGALQPDPDFEPGLRETVFFDPVAMSYPTALHLAVLLVDSETGAVTLRNYFAVDDCGRVINPMVVEGQVHGGIAQGFGQALLEELRYDPDTGQLLTGTFMDYAMPRADLFPDFELAFQQTLNPNNPLGAKGCSETGIVAAPIAISNALMDALWPLGVRELEMPYTAETVWRAIQNAREDVDHETTRDPT